MNFFEISYTNKAHFGHLHQKFGNVQAQFEGVINDYIAKNVQKLKPQMVWP